MKTAAIALASALACAPIAARAECTPGVASQDQKAIEVIDGLYVSLLGRHAEPAGQAYWSGYYNCGVPVERIVDAIKASPEYRGRK